jgi:hypothetical protein
VRIVKPNGLAGKVTNKSPNRPDWYAEWLANQGKYVLLKCGCMTDVHLPACITLLTGKRIYIECPSNNHLDPHGFQEIKKTLTTREYLTAKGFHFADDPGLIPPF